MKQRNRIVMIVMFLMALSIPMPVQSAFEYLERGVSVVYTSQAKPFCFIDDRGEAQGLVVDFWRLWSRKTGVPVTIHVAPWSETFQLVLNGTYDIHGGFMHTDERERNFDFSVPFFTLGSHLIVKSGKNIDKSAIVVSRTIGVIEESMPGMSLTKTYPGVRLKAFKKHGELMVAFADGDIDAIAMDLPTFHFNNANLPKPVDYSASPILVERHIRAGIVKGNPELLALIDKGFNQISASKRLKILERWFVSAPSSDHPSVVLWLSLVVLLFGGIVLLFNQIAATRR